MVSYCRPNDLRMSINSILQNTDLPYRLTILDNSVGKADTTLNRYNNYQYVNIIRNETNVGKAVAFKRHYDKIMQYDDNDLFVSIDGDIIVEMGWLSGLVNARRRISQPFAILAPIIKSNKHDTAENQLRSNRLTMHDNRNMLRVTESIIYNRFTAGPLFLIDKKFYSSVGGYDEHSFYGKDDGLLCKSAADRNLFIGITTDVEVTHSRSDEDKGYQDWKAKAIKTSGPQSGYWDV